MSLRELRSAILMLVVMAVMGVPLVFAAQDIPTFRSDVNLVDVTFSARGANGALVSDLTQDEIKVLEDDVPQKVRFFSRATLPLTIGLIVDASGSQESFYRAHRRDVEKFLKNVLGTEDKVFLVCFGNRLRLASDATSSVDELMAAYERFDRGERGAMPELGPKDEERVEGTALFDAVYYATREKLAEADRGRRTLLVFSDGEDNSSAHHMLDAIEAAQGSDVLVYSIRYTDQKKARLKARNKYGMSVMQRISKDTGGLDFDATRGADLDRTFREIGAELRTLYEVAYHASNPRRDGTFRRIAVRTIRPGLALRTRAGYFAQ
jgi:Ca-activated chloride channel family protein